MIAAERGHALAAAYLLEKGAERGRRDKQQKTALDLAKDERVRRVLAN
jgi:ankyrin repeat protein